MGKIRSITVNFNAGSAKFGTDVDKNIAKIKQFGGHTVSNMQASSAAIRTFEGNIQNNVRAVERFMTSVLPLGPVLQAAFPIVGAVAFLGLMTETSKRASEFFKEMREAPERIKNAFSSAVGGLRLTNDELKVANDRLENDIAKLEGKHQNTLKLALDEAVKSADTLAKSLDKDLEALHKLVAEDSKNWFQKHVWDIGGDGDFGEELRHFRTKTEDITRQGATEMKQGPAVNIHGAMIPGEVTQESVEAARKRMNERLQAAYDQEIANVEDRLRAAQGQRGPLLYKAPSGENVYGERTGGDEKQAALAGGALDYLRSARAQIPLSAQNEALTVRKDELTAGKENAAQDRPFDKYLAETKAKISALKAQMEAIGKGEAAQVAAKSFGAAAEAIARISEAMKARNAVMDAGQKQAVRAVNTEMAQVETDAEWKRKLEASNVAIDDRIRSQNLLTAAIGKGYEATKQANVETRVMQELGQHYGDAGWMKDHAADVSGLRSGFAKEYDAQHADQVGQAVQKLREEIELEKALASAQREGAEAVRQAGLAVRLRQMAAVGATKAQLQAEIELYNAQRGNDVAGEVAKIEEKIAATERLTTAIAGGAAAVRQASLANQLVAIAREGDVAVPGVIGIGQRGLATVGADSADHAKDVAELGARTNRLRLIDEEIAKLKEVTATEDNALAIEIARRDLENQRLDQLVKESLALRGASDGVRAFFLEMQKDAESAAEIVYKALNSSVDRVSGNLAKLFTGQKTEWAKSFRDIGESMVQSSTKSLIQKGIGAAGKIFGVDIGGAKPDGSRGNPLWVQMAGGPAFAGAGGGTFGGGSQGGAIFSMFGKLFGGGRDSNFGGTVGEGAANPFEWGGFMAEGGDMNPSKAYVVGDQGPEVIAGISARVISNGDATKMFGGGGMTFTNHIDARGADLGAHNRIQRGIEMSSRAAAATAVQAMAERQKRTAR